jgi:heptosyltransferase-3
MYSSESPLLIIHQGALGDLLLSLPALLSLRRHHRGSRLALAGNPANLALLQRRLRVRDLYSTLGKDWAGLYQETPRLTERLAALLREFQRVYVLAPRPPDRLVENIRRAGPAEVFWIPSFPDQAAGKSVPLVQEAALTALSVPWISPQVYLVPGRLERSAGENLLKEKGLEFARLPVWAVHPGSGGLQKNWPIENFLALAERLRQEKAAAPFFILGPVEKEVRPEIRALIRGLGFPILEEVTPTLLAGALSRSAAYLGNDSGVTHLASCLNLPTLALFGTTDPRLWGPIGRKTVILHSPDGPWQTLTVEAVLRECLGLLASAG